MRAWWKREPESAEERWVVLDVETTGLDPRRAELLAVAALGVHCDWTGRRLSLCPGDSLSVRLRPARVSADRANVLVHGLGTGRQREGLPPPEALAAVLRFTRGARLLAFHAAFDRALLQRQLRRHLGQRLEGEWLDIAQLCRTAHAGVPARSLDEWLAYLGIDCLSRHDAAADVLAEAELLQRIWPRVARECGSWRELRRYAAREAWMA